MNIAASLVESYMYADMFNREGGSEKVFVGGVPVDHILPALRKELAHKEQEGGNPSTNANSSCGGPFKHKVIPAGLVIINVHKDPDVQYEEYFHPSTSREVISDSMYDMLFASVRTPERPNRAALHSKRRTPPKHTHHPLKQNRRSRKQKNKSIDIKAI